MWVVLVVVLVTGGKQSQLLLQPTKVELGLQVGVGFDNILTTPFKHPSPLPMSTCNENVHVPKHDTV